MSSSKIACEFIFNRFSISHISEKNGMSKAEVVKSIFSFLKSHPNSSHKESIRRKLKIELAKAFLSSPASPDRFAEEYGMDPRDFRKLMKEVVDDYDIVSSDTLADKLFRKVMAGTVLVAKYIPKRIVKQIALIYVCENHYTQDGLASIYGTRRETIAAILRRGIAENILDDVTAEKVIVQIRSYNKSIDSYDQAFDERAKLKAKQA
ncbi:MAG: hypothetical protein IJ272_07120 [Clostridia bacterium]|nr:hypothetical protein [Clostridia bacterium]